MTGGGSWASLGNHSLPVSAKIVSGPLPTQQSVTLWQVAQEG